jgi:hypothetical protein
MADVPRVLYLAAPMVRIREHDFLLFIRVAERLRTQGYQVFNPTESRDGDVR